MSSLASQLAQIAANSRSTLNTKVLKAAHSKSLIFEPRVAATQTYPEIYSICLEGFEELCNLDSRFTKFTQSLWSPQSQEADRTQMSAAENAALDKHVEAFLHLCGSRLRLMPTIKAIEWLIRRFRVHEFNTAALIATFLPYHTIPAFVTLLSILPANIPKEYRFLDPYIRSLTAPPRAAIVQQATNRPELLTAISQYTLDSCKYQMEYPGLISFWGGVMVEATNGLLDKYRSGRRSIQIENDNALMQQLGPVLSDAMVMKSSPGLQIASYMVVTILAAKGGLADNALTAFMDQLVHGWTPETMRPGLVTLCIISQHRSAKQLSARVTKALLKVPEVASVMNEIGKDHRVDKLANGLALALVDRLHKKGDVRSLPVVNSLLLGNVLREKQIKVVYKSLLVAAHRINDQVDQDGAIRKELGTVLVSLSQAGGEVGDIVRATIDEVDFDIDALELTLGASIRPKLAVEDAPEAAAEDNNTPKVDKEAQVAQNFEKLSKLKPQTASCFAEEPLDLLEELYSLFLSVAANESNLQKFDEAPVLSRPQAPTKLFYASFYMRLWCGSLPTLAKVAALDRVKNLLKDEEFATLDFQAVVPYAIVALSDPAKKVRRAAAELVTVLGSFYETKPSKARRVWGSEGLYAKNAAVNWLDFDATKSLIHSVLIPSLEESILHEDHILAALTNALESSKSKDGDKKHLSHSTRFAIFKFLSSHVVGTPLIAVKLRLLQSLNQIKSISGTSRTDLLLSLLQWWARLSEAEAQQLLAREAVDEASVNNAFVDVVIANNEAGLRLIFELIRDSNVITRNGLVQSLFSRVQKIWSSMKAETQFSTARALLTLSQAVHPTSSEPDVIATEATDVLHKVELTTDILLDFLESLYDDIKKATEKPATKRRRVGSSEKSVDSQSPADVSASLSKATFVLELVQESEPAKHPELLPSLFTTLSELQHLRTVVGSELGYLQSLVLSSLLAMMPAYKDSKELTIDPAAGHGDILASCIQRSSSPTVINAALLLVASLARTAPDVVLHSVMPIFTFMGSSVLKQADDYSAHVVNQTVKEVIPPLIETFRKSRRNLVASTAELLTSFVVAYEHIPSHRKQDLFITLIENLGPEDFLFAVLAMFVDKYGATDNMLAFTTQIIGSFSVEIQLQTLIKHLDLISDIFKPKPVLSAALLAKVDSNSEQDVVKLATKQLTLLPKLLVNRRLRHEISGLAEKDDMESVKIRELYAQLLEGVLTLAGTVKPKKDTLYTRCAEALSNLLNLLSIAEFIKSVEALLDRPNVILRQKVLRALERRVDSESINNPKSREALLAFLPQLTAVIRESDDMNYKHTAVNCVDKIAEKYGKKDLDAVAAAAATIAGDSCLGQPSQELRVMALLCLASLVDVLQDAIVPVLPIAIPKALGCLEESIKAEKPDGALHNAAYAFMAALAQHIPYMISGAYLDRLLVCSNASAAAGLNEECRDSRTDCLQFVAKLIEGKVLFTALEKNWANAASSGYLALEEYLHVLGTALDKHPKSSIAKNTTLFTGIFLNAFDLRRSGVLSSTQELEKIELLINETSLKMIYKLNDAAFRPMFSHLMEWSTTGLPKSDLAGKAQRQVSTYGFLQHFFENLKSIVTSYASYIIDSAVKILSAPLTSDDVLKTLRSRVLRTLTKCFEHDQDGFWQAPAHFNAVAPVLVAQFGHAAGADNCTNDLVLAVVELAAAADSKEHHKEINSALLKHLRSEQAAVRLAVIKCEQELTARLGEEWLQSLPEMLPFISELQDDDDEVVERENRRWIVGIEETLGESLDNMLQ
ncbi:U3 small nucleolar RNA-associated protein 10 [Neurospora crassa]|uniref:U3 small nucleolar RNA-associated protein 10 n=1 Tax=Neurospora crassa (strain ATCC 24698 / 74-OR23-1A / CBS 708.71 / DSM 1257 / FGSC 987) TaxID=367110 RepID=UTP10_NEUCR|nr:U3 small nucleolar RNA-associated protein 10 [Neurospora crassa OR74A]Q7RZM8.1 RecName: Full=U3 small nucleolar RNA-associated protein 10; AltName: Full=Ribosome biogenesis protein 5 [Neurospora crassa OR74A]EAA28571.1 U3 small nucleolar RNA-associated protein 10 [Neurospora crassa OR74A]KHE89557.1 U3 small nucleolar RNA-associated protein 10 [Neurospora crassa]|eukprot:XP_957807.1 U3 small nucleolar RNA-associated protein 10 [Neurospora crassa OR74A]